MGQWCLSFKAGTTQQDRTPPHLTCHITWTVQVGNFQVSFIKFWPCTKWLSKQLRWSSGSVLPLSTQVRGFKPGRSCQDFQGEKILCTPSFRREVKLWVTCHRFAACKRSLNWSGSRNLRQNYRLILAHIVPPFQLGSLASLWTWRYLAANVLTSKQAGGDRVSTICLLGCSTSVALATCPTDEEVIINCFSLPPRNSWLSRARRVSKRQGMQDWLTGAWQGPFFWGIQKLVA